MTFQFLCPQGHLLEGEEAHMGMQCQCPQCGTAFIIPTVGQAQQPAGQLASPQEELEPIEAPALGPRDALEELAAAEADAVAAAPAAPAESALPDNELDDELPYAEVDETILHIPCPNGHELETPLDMIGQKAACPHCGVEFRLKREKSVEYFREREILERRRARLWFQLAIVAAGFVGVLLLAMILMAAFL